MKDEEVKPDETTSPEEIGARAESEDDVLLIAEAELDAVEEEARVVEEAALTAAASKGQYEPAVKDSGTGGESKGFTLGPFEIGIVAVIALFAGMAIWQAHQDIDALTGKLDGYVELVERDRASFQLSAIWRARAELKVLADTLTPELAARVVEADAILEEVSGKLASGPSKSSETP